MRRRRELSVLSFLVLLAASAAAVHVAAQEAPAPVAVEAPPPAAAPAEPPPRTALELAAMPLGEMAGDVELSWRAFLDEQGFREGKNPGNIFIASGAAIVAFPRGSAGWIEARRVAFQIAELRAKVALVRLLGIDVSQSKDFTMLENTNFGQGYIDEVATMTQAERILQGVADFTEVAINTMIQQLDPTYDPTQYRDRQAREVRLAETLNERIRIAVARSVSAALTFHVIEGPATIVRDGLPTVSLQTQIFAAVLWSPALSQLATDIGDTEYGMQLVEAVGRAEDYLPQNRGQAVTSFGTQVIVNERGQRALISYGQAEPAAVSPEQQARAQQAALERAETFAIGQMAAFVGERLTATMIVESQALLREYLGLAQTGAEIDANNIQRIQVSTAPFRLVGAEVIMRQVVPHPETGQPVAIVAVLWSPAGVEAANAIREAMDNAARPPAPGARPPPAPEPQAPIILERQPGNPAAF